MTIHIEGRGIYRRDPSIEIHAGNDAYSDPIFTLNAGNLEINRDRGTFRVISKHKDGTDIEHDAAYVFVMDGIGLEFMSMHANRVTFRGAALEFRYYPSDFKIENGADLSVLKNLTDDIDDVISICNDTEYYHPSTQSEWPAGHLLMPYMPPRQAIKPGQVTVVTKFGSE